jgi:alpha-maltose-1-phosphate synthase
MRVGLLTKEWPPEIYGGAGVHVDFLARELRRLVEVDVHCFGQPRDDARAHSPAAELADANAALQTLSVDLSMAASLVEVDLVHSHTWYANMAGHLAGAAARRPARRHRPLARAAPAVEGRAAGRRLRLSSWAERTAYLGADAVIAVSDGMRADILDCYPDLDPDRVHVVRNGIDTELYRPWPRAPTC